MPPPSVSIDEQIIAVRDITLALVNQLATALVNKQAIVVQLSAANDVVNSLTSQIAVSNNNLLLLINQL